MEKKCEVCNNTFKIKPSHYHLRRTCSRRCASVIRSKEKSGKNHWNWKGGIEQHNTGHIKIYDPKHPAAHKGKVFHHRLIMEKHIGRMLDKNEIVHHINGDKTDNRIENLQIMTRAEHINEHREQITAGKKNIAKRDSLRHRLGL